MDDRSLDVLASEIDELTRRWGAPLRHVARLARTDFDPLTKRDRAGEVCMVVRRPNGKILVSIKTFYPRAGWRLPTGGIDLGEPIGSAVEREVHEETGLDTRVERYLASIEYRDARTDRPVFRTHAFLIAELGGTLAPLDEHEGIEAYREIDVAELPAIAAALESLGSEAAPEIGGDWHDWGRFRAVVHRVVYEVLAGRTAAA